MTLSRYAVIFVIKAGDFIMINKIMKEKHITKYRLSKDSNVPYSTISDICSGKTHLEKCSAETVYKIAKVLDITMEELVEGYAVQRIEFELFKSNVCHKLKELGDTEFIIRTLESNEIRMFYQKKWYPECLYMLAMLDYISRVNNIPICSEYNDIRKMKLKDVLYPEGIIAYSIAFQDEDIKSRALSNAIPEFIRFNIVESEVRDVI